MSEQPVVREFLAAVCARVRCSEVHPAIRLELAGHIADLTEAGLAAGLPEAEAVGRAVVQMGDPDTLGRQLHQVHRPRTEWGLLAATALLVLLGLWAMYAVDRSEAVPVLNGFFAQKAVWTGVGLAFAVGAYFADYRRLLRQAWTLYALALLATAAVCAIGPRAFGRPLYADVTPILFVPALAGLFTGWDFSAGRTSWRTLGVLAAPLLFYVLGRASLSTIGDYLLGCGAVLLAVRPRRWQVAAYAAIVLGVLVAGVLNLPYGLARLQVWLHPQADWALRQSLQAMRDARLWGRGATAAVPLLLPGGPSEFVFPYIVHTLGWVAGAAICLLALGFVSRLAHVVRRAGDRPGTALVSGFAALFAVHYGWNLLMTLGLAPYFGVEMPFLSEGGRQVLYMAAVGLALSVFRRKDLLAPADM